MRETAGLCMIGLLRRFPAGSALEIAAGDLHKAKADPLISPALGDLTGFPPTFLSVGGTEILLKDSLTFARNAAKAGCDVRLHVGKDMIHTYPLDLWDYPEAMTAFEEMELFVRQILR